MQRLLFLSLTPIEKRDIKGKDIRQCSTTFPMIL
jgi:hypothetical protein